MENPLFAISFWRLAAVEFDTGCWILDLWDLGFGSLFKDTPLCG